MPCGAQWFHVADGRAPPGRFAEALRKMRIVPQRVDRTARSRLSIVGRDESRLAVDYVGAAAMLQGLTSVSAICRKTVCCCLWSDLK